MKSLPAMALLLAACARSGEPPRIPSQETSRPVQSVRDGGERDREASVPADDVEIFSAGGYELRLVSSGGSCELAFSGSHSGAVELSIPGPCRVYRDRTGRPQLVQRNGIGVLLVGSVRPHSDSPNTCDAWRQGILIKDREVVPTLLTEELGGCGLGADRAVFEYYAEHGLEAAR